MRDGLLHKYDVRKADTGEVVADCFVLRPDTDPAARVALLAYARATDNALLGGDLARWVQAAYAASEQDRFQAVREQLAEAELASAVARASQAQREAEEAAWELDQAQDTLALVRARAIASDEHRESPSVQEHPPENGR